MCISFDINLTVRYFLLLSVVRPSLEYGSEIRESQARALESVILGGAKKILGCSAKTCNEAGDMGFDRARTIDDIFHSLSLCEILDDMHEGHSSFMGCVEEDLRRGKPRSLENDLIVKVWGGRGVFAWP